ncbi:hypothetical protein GOZ97_07545 [Agrobacterium vitis]|uniref:hypothetical protein n=1 Tax=Agrobacterium vitis TaxID=373 RepID=UPI0008FB7D52|nr:hypothetical protein [Agrobacterium vitis]MUZ53053.1 hypothetical protein [Agrobacterium vitis]MUZ91272.1 hypothetical protein [Agrobacterium vitis]MVA40284.1 hypothetical protein [Agrobacterium vitis]NSX96130.1 hypothetical protein [Agrobacterium vitis]NSZ27269.1 hypothetical protein [Agrobacterium vitis]
MISASSKPPAAPGLYVVTNCPQAAAIDLFHCDLELVPAWARIVSDVGDLAAIPTNAKVMALWFGPIGIHLHQRSMIEQEWREERRRRSFNDDFGAHEAALKAWHDKRWAVDAPAMTAEPPPAPSASVPPSSLPAVCQPDRAAPSSLPRKSRWS